MAKKVKEFKNIVVAKTYDEGLVVLVTGPEPEVAELFGLMEDVVFEHYGFGELNEIDDLPAGLYLCAVEFWFEQGYFEGYPADGESSVYFVVKDPLRIA